MENKPTVCVVGSINMDLTISTKKMPSQGETVLGENNEFYPGGKGANQAVAAARLGAHVHMIGCVGDDETGVILRNHLKSEGICIKGVHVSSEVKTGIAHIILSENDNRIIVSPGANRFVSEDLVDAHEHLIKNSDIVLLQLEIPLETVMHTLKVANKFNVPVILNPAPYRKLPDFVLQSSTYLTPNEIEVAEMKSSKLFDSIQEKIIVTRGDKGVRFFEDGYEKHMSSLLVEVEDTTGAGDTFNGALATELGLGSTLSEAIQFANIAAGLSVTKVGAQDGMPTRDEVEVILANQNDFGQIKRG